MNTMKKTAIAIAATATLSLTACGIAPEDESAALPSSSSSEVTPGTSTEEATPDETTPDETPEPSTETDSMIVGFGESFTWEDGVKVMLSEPQPFQKSEWAAGGEGYEHYVKITVTIVNDSDAAIDASFTTPTVQSGQREGDSVFDTDNGLEGSPLSSILPGRTVTFEAGYGIDDPADVIAEFAPSWDHQPAYWTGGGEQA